jgi:hypothetical protein
MGFLPVMFPAAAGLSRSPCSLAAGLITGVSLPDRDVAVCSLADTTSSRLAPAAVGQRPSCSTLGVGYVDGYATISEVAREFRV